MKKTVRIFLIYFLSITTFLFISVSCRTTSGKSNDYNKIIESVKIGMTKEEVIAILGDQYTNFSMSESPEGILSTIFYRDNKNSFIYYYIYFLNDHLVEWVREYDSDSANRTQSSGLNWFQEQDRKAEFNKMKDLKEREVKALEKANEEKEKERRRSQ